MIRKYMYILFFNYEKRLSMERTLKSLYEKDCLTEILESNMLLAYESLCRNTAKDKEEQLNQDIYNIIIEKTNQICMNTSVNICVHKLEEYDKSTYLHSVRVSILCMAIGKLMGFDKNKIMELGLAGLLHDIGKLFVPIDIITKPGRLDEIEKVLIFSHPASSAYYLRENYKNISDDIIWGVAEHHERLDGSGYPRKLRGDEISLIGRIIAIADIFEAYSSERSYHKKRSVKETVEFIQKVSGLDQEILGIFISHLNTRTGAVEF